MNKMEWNKITVDEETGNLENLPDEGEYIFSFKDGTVMADELGWTDSETGWGVYLASGYDPADLTAWMPMPEPPKEKSDDRMDEKVSDIELIDEICTHTDCLDCPFFDDSEYIYIDDDGEKGECMFKKIPMYWKTKTIGEIINHEKEEL